MTARSRPRATRAACGRQARGTIITLKGLERQDDGGATHRREELEGPADPAMPPALWPPSIARDAVVQIVGDRTLRDLVSLRQVRRKRNYARNGTVVEVSVDDVEVMVGVQVAERFAELELELRDGEEVDLEPLADMLGEIEELVAVDSSKFERALEVVRREPREPEADDADGPAEDGSGLSVVEPAPSHGRSGAQRRKRRKAALTAPVELVAIPIEPDAGDAASVEAAAPATEEEAPAEAPRILVPKTPGVLADDHLAEAGRKVLRFHLARMVAREAGTREGKDAEELHAMRVATRRQRAAWRVFGDAFDPERTARHRRRLRAGRRRPRCGPRPRRPDRGHRGVPGPPVRGRGRGPRAARPVVAGAAGRGPGRARPRARRRSLHPLARRLPRLRPVGGPGRPRRRPDGAAPSARHDAVADVGRVRVGPRVRVRDALGRRPTLHELRIAAKWLRYTLEFVREALGRDAGPVIEKVVALQDHLGWLHDADVAAGLARAFLVEHAGDLTELESAAIGRYLVDRERTLAKLRRTVGVPWRGVSSLAFRRSLGRLVAGL